MRRNMKKEFRQSMDGLRFSDRTKEEMTQMLIQKTNEQSRQRRTSGRKLLVLSLAAVLLVTLAGAATFTRWSRNAQNRYQPSQDIKEQAEKTGLSVMLETSPKGPQSGEILSATDQGITITAVQSIIDDYTGEITFRIEGFDLPEGRYPHVWPVITIDGESPLGSISGHFFDGTTRNEAGQRVYADTGLPVEYNNDEFQSVILKPVARDGSMEFTSTFAFREKPFSVDNKEILVVFDGIGIQSDEKAGIPTYLVEGNWELRWTLHSSSDAISIAPNAPVGENGVTLLTAEIGQKTIVATYQLKEYWAGHEVMDTFPEAIQGVRMKDGTEYRCYPSTSGYRTKDGSQWASHENDDYKDMSKTIYYMEFSMSDALLDPSQVESLLFHKGWESDGRGQPTRQIFEYLPIS